MKIQILRAFRNNAFKIPYAAMLKALMIMVASVAGLELKTNEVPVMICFCEIVSDIETHFEKFMWRCMHS